MTVTSPRFSRVLSKKTVVIESSPNKIKQNQTLGSINSARVTHRTRRRLHFELPVYCKAMIADTGNYPDGRGRVGSGFVRGSVELSAGPSRDHSPSTSVFTD